MTVPPCDKCPAKARSTIYYGGEEHHLCTGCRRRIMDLF